MSSLWMGRDHLVYVRGNGYLIPLSEKYKRYRFEDIQAISISKKSRIGAAILYGLGLLSFAGPLVLVLALMDEGDLGMGAAISISILALGALLFTSLLLRHLILGPTCVCDLQTSLSRDRIRSLNRFHASRQCIDVLAERIQQVQEPLRKAAEVSVVELDEGDRKEAETFTVPAPVIPTFVGVLLLGIGALATLHLESITLTITMLLILLLVSFSLNFSLIASVRKLTPEAIRSNLWIAMGLLFVFVGSATVYLLISAARNPVYTLDFMGPLEALTGVANGGGLGFYLVFLGLSLGFFACGLVGILNSLKWKALIQGTEPVTVNLESPSSE